MKPTVKEAVALLEHVVDVHKKTLDESHPDRLASQHALAGAYQDNGQIKEAVAVLKHVADVKEKTLHKGHPSRLASQHALAGVYQANEPRGNLDDIEASCETCSVRVSNLRLKTISTPMLITTGAEDGAWSDRGPQISPCSEIKCIRRIPIMR